MVDTDHGRLAESGVTETTMAYYQISSTASVDFGVYQGATPREAFESMLAAANARSQYGEWQVGTEDDWIITPMQYRVEGRLQSGQWTSEAVVAGDDWAALCATMDEAERAIDDLVSRLGYDRADLRIVELAP